MNEFLNKVISSNIGKVEKKVFLSKYTTYKVGGMAEAIIYPKNIDALITLIKLIKFYKVQYKVLGNGSNVLFSDKKYNGVLIKLSEFNHIEWNNNKVTVGAGVSLPKLSLMAAKKSLTGLEFAAGIPGTIGGAVFMNAGAYKSDMGYIVSSVKVLTRDLKIINMTNREMDFHYRTSFLKKHPTYICLEATLRKGKKDAIESVIKERRKRRMESQPLEYASAGSVFRNPEGMFAGELIEKSGLKGLKKGGAMISNKHANFIVNTGNASSDDIKYLIDFAHDTVKKNYKVDMKIEQEFVNWE